MTMMMMMIDVTTEHDYSIAGTSIPIQPYTIAAYRRIYWLRLIGLVQRSAVTWRFVLHSSDEPGELSQWQCTATTTAT